MRAAVPLPGPMSSSSSAIPAGGAAGLAVGAAHTYFGLAGWRFVVMTGSAGRGAGVVRAQRRVCRKARAGWRSRGRSDGGRRRLSRPGKLEAQARKARTLARTAGRRRLKPPAGAASGKSSAPPYLGRTARCWWCSTCSRRRAITALPAGCRRLLIASGIEVTKIAGLHLHHRHRCAIRAFAGRHVVHRQDRAQMDHRRARRWRLRWQGLAFTQARSMAARAVRLRRGADPGQQHSLLSPITATSPNCFPPACGRRPWGSSILFRASPPCQRLRHRRHPQGLRRAGGLCLHCRLHGVVVVVIGLFGPRTRNLTLEQISR